MSQSSLIVAKFGGTSVADFTAMNRSADVVLADPNVRVVVLSASAGVTNLLVSLAEGQEQERRAFLLDEIRRIQYAIIDELRQPTVIRDEIDRMLENITMLSEAAALATSTALTDELVSHGELMSTLLFVEILRQRDVASEWFDVRKVMRTDDHFGRAQPDTALLADLAQAQLAPRLNEALIITQGFIGSEAKGRTTTLGRGGSDYTAALLGEALNASRIDIWTDVRAFTLPIPAWCLPPNALMRSPSKKPRKWPLSARKCCIRPRYFLRCAMAFRCLWVPAKILLRAVRACAIRRKTRRCSVRWRCAVNKPC